MTANADHALAKRLLERDERAFNQFFSAYFPRLFRFTLTRVGGDEDLAEEATQRAMCKAIDKLDTYRGDAPLFSWLCTFCRHEAYALNRDRLREAVPVAEEDPAVRHALEVMLGPELGDPNAVVTRSDIARRVHQTLDALPSLYSDLLEWKYFHGMSVKDMARRIDRGAKATESLLTRSRNAFRTAFRDDDSRRPLSQPDIPA